MNNKEQLGGTGNDFKHQIIISYIIYGLMQKFLKLKSYKNFVVLPELSLNPTSTKIPDITVRRLYRGYPTEAVLLIEICKTNKVKDDIKKLSQLMEEIHSIKECFIIDKDNMEVNKIIRTKTNKPSVAKKDSKIEMFKLDLLELLKLIP